MTGTIRTTIARVVDMPPHSADVTAIKATATTTYGASDHTQPRTHRPVHYRRIK